MTTPTDTIRNAIRYLAWYTNEVQAAAWAEGYARGITDMRTNTDVTHNPYMPNHDE